MFQSKGQILTADYLDRSAGGVLRFPEAYAAVDEAERVAYLVAVLPGHVGPLEQEFQHLQVSYRKYEIGGLALLVPEHRIHPAEVVGGLGFQY